MSIVNVSQRFTRSSRLASGAIAIAIAEEATALAQALLHPNRLVAAVEHMHALQVEADRIEARDPARAAVLRQQAARLGLR